MLRFPVFALLTLAGCEVKPSDLPEPRELLRHEGSVKDARPLESVTGPLHFAQGCWTVSSGPNRIALYFPREATLLETGEIGIGARVLREGEVYKFVGDLAETGVDSVETCNGLPASIAVGDVWAVDDGDRVEER